MRQQMPSSCWQEAAKRGCHTCVTAPSWRVRLLCFWAAMVLWAGAVQACDTPVYQYTMQMWQRDPYRVYYFYSGAERTADAPINEYLERIAKGAGAHVNLAFLKVDVSDLESAESSSLAQQVWARHQSRPRPFYVILTPRWTELFVGQVDLDDVQAMMNSPKTKQLAEQLCQGKQGVLLLLLASNQQESAAAQRVVREVLAEVADGDQEVGFVVVTRGDPQEEWLVRQLLRLEDDLPDLDDAMVFGVFGRGHVLEPYLGKGITKENLLELVAFMRGPCSCEVKASSAGMDLLTNCDWQTQVANWPEPAEAPLPSLLFDIPVAPDTEATDSAPVPGAKTGGQKKPPPADQAPVAAKLVISPPGHDEEVHSSPGPPAERGQKPESQAQEEGSESASAAAGPDATSLLKGSVAAGDDQLPGAGHDRTRFAPQLAHELQIEENSSWGSVLSVRLVLMLGAAAILVVALSLTFIWRRRER